MYLTPLSLILCPEKKSKVYTYELFPSKVVSSTSIYL